MIKDVLQAADLERREINDVPLAAMYRLSALGMIDRGWQRGDPRGAATGRVPHYDHVRLTNRGVQQARRVKASKPER